MFLEDVLTNVTKDERKVLLVLYAEEAMLPEATGKPELVAALVKKGHVCIDGEWLVLAVHTERAMQEEEAKATRSEINKIYTKNLQAAKEAHNGKK